MRTIDNSTLTTQAYSPDAADDITNRDSMFRQFVSPQLAAQTLSGNVTAQLQGSETNNGNNLFLTLVIKVISSDGTTVRQTILASTRAPGAEFTTSLRNTTFDSVALTNYTCVAGDRLLVEAGMGGTCTASGGVQGHNGALRWGTNASSGDLPVNETEAGTTYRGWIEFSSTFTWNDPDLTPGVAAMTTSRQSPTVQTPRNVVPGLLAVTTTQFTPAVAAGGGVEVTPGVASLTSSRLTPTVTATANQNVTPGVLASTTTRQTPTAVASDNKEAVPGVLAATTTRFTPAVTAGVEVVPGIGTMSSSRFTPTVAASNNQNVIPGLLSLITTRFVPTVVATANVNVVPGVRAVVTTLYTATVAVSGEAKKLAAFLLGWGGGSLGQ